ncbi:MAG TPA: glycine betaine ABC transporter substrate-binding protein [Bacillales bacterium]
MKKLFTALMTLMMLFSLSACGGSGNSGDGSITIDFGTQKYLDPKIASEMVKALIEARTDHEVKITKNIQASPQIIQAMDQDELDMALLFSGELYNHHFDEDKVKFTTDPQKTIQQAQKLFAEKFNFKWFDSLGYANEYAIAVPGKWAKQHHVKTIADLKPYADKLTIGADTSWVHREKDGYPAFKETYFGFGEVKGMNVSLMYKAIKSNDVDAILAYTVDPQIEKLNLRILKDTKNFFPPYDASLVVRKELLQNYPEVKKILSSLVGKISTEEMTHLIYLVQFKGKTQKEVAIQYLKKEGLLKDDQS